MSSYQPTFTLSSDILELVVAISEQVEHLSAATEAGAKLASVQPTIQNVTSSLALEGSSLSDVQVSAIAAGARVTAPARQILAASNALDGYAQMAAWQPQQSDALLQAHRILMQGLSHCAGEYRSGSVGTMGGGEASHVGPAASEVPHLMGRLFNWLAHSDGHHPLVSSAVFHYELAYVRPFTDGNGRLARLWHTRLLQQWQPLFSLLSLSRRLHQHREDYCQAICQDTTHRDATSFIRFMLEMIQQTLLSEQSLQVTPQASPHVSRDISGQMVSQGEDSALSSAAPQVSFSTTPQATPQVILHVTPQVEKLITVLEGQQSREELQTTLGLTDRKSFRQRYLKPALEAGLIEMTRPEKPQSCLQAYRLTYGAKARLAELKMDG